MDNSTDEITSTSELDIILDGYGLPFPPEVQQRHRENVQKAMREYYEWLSSQKVESIEPVWIDKPAGWQSEKGSGI